MRSMGCKAAAFVLCVVSILLVPLCAVGAWFMAEQGFYVTSENAMVYNACRSRVATQATDTVFRAVTSAAERYFDRLDAGESAEDTRLTFLAEGTEPEVWFAGDEANLCFTLYDGNGDPAAVSTKSDDGKPHTYTFHIPFSVTEYEWLMSSAYDSARYERQEKTGRVYPPFEEAAKDTGVRTVYTFDAYLPDKLPYIDEYALIVRGVRLLYALRFAVYPIGIGAGLLAVFLFVYLMCVSGRRPRTEELCPGAFYRVPFDVMLAVSALIVVFGAGLTDELYGEPTVVRVVLLAVLILYAAAAFLGLCMSAAARIKAHTLISGTLIFRVCAWLIKGVRAVLRGMKRLFFVIPLVWRTALTVTAFILIDLFATMRYQYDEFPVWLIRSCVLFLIAVVTAWALRRLQKAGEALAAGDLSHRTETGHLSGAFRRHAENLNAVSEGMNRAVEARLKSERMKTELITNVSHDIKTPLTTIINYSDLIEKNASDGELVKEYAEVLHRHSVRLVRLLEDLVEASKASSGALEITLAPCDVSVILTQAAGEYEEKLAESGLTLMMNLPETDVYISADGRRLWRVVDNLMNNIVKYAQSGTRVYLSLSVMKDGRAAVVFRNTSREPLDISPDELTERFVRGDRSRSTEGSGLGLSIAKSLTELQSGTFAVAIDGDLFKVMLTFPILQTNGYETEEEIL